MPVAEQLTTTFDTLRLQLARTPVPGLARKVAEAWRALLPASLRPLFQADAGQLRLRREGESLQVSVHGPDGERALGELPLSAADALAARLSEGSSHAWLVLPAGAVLRRTLSLPAAALPRLRDVLAHEIDRQTPFPADQVSYEGRVLAHPPAGQPVPVELVVLPRARLEQELQAIGPLAGQLAGVDALDAQGRPLGLDLLPPAQRPRRRDPVRRLNGLLAAVAGGALLLAMLVVLNNRASALEALRADVAAASVEVREARVARNELVARTAAANFIATRRAASPTMLEVLDDLTRRIPDDTAIDKLTIFNGQISLVGQSRGAPALVGLLQASPLLEEPALSGAVQADPRTGRDRFTLVARVVGAEREKAP